MIQSQSYDVLKAVGELKDAVSLAAADLQVDAFEDLLAFDGDT